ncbi:hypothetical protein [Klebsiella sp. Ap-874]|uniref:hypothetical protein n=1 Tax=Klebsiella sp. Ap-874 TaxID=2608352 RepID=UPI0014196F9A|nr:hypothetical protein [Klebsiella sp. Ap-874]NIG47621.1 hypothetical protein [Klebsiella sp. Ap-874]NIG72854.1 hypothetical protein [Klebsiella sp. Ap-873]
MWLIIGGVCVVVVISTYCVYSAIDSRLSEMFRVNKHNIDLVLDRVYENKRSMEELSESIEFIKEELREVKESHPGEGVRRIDKEILAHIKLIGRVQYNIFEDSQNTWNTLHSYLTDLDLSGKYKYEWSTRDPEDSYEIFRKQARDSATYFLDGYKGFYENED